MSRRKSLQDLASLELQNFRCKEEDGNKRSRQCLPCHESYFPTACLELLYQLPGNNKCVDCGARNPEWASVTYGTTLCLECAGHHRNMGVKTSFVRSIFMDTWSQTQILCMLEGGNHQLQRFFERHHLTEETFSAISSTSSTSTCSSSDDENQEVENNQFGSNQLESNRVQRVVSDFPTFPSSLIFTAAMDEARGISSVRYRTKAALFYREQLSQHVSSIVELGRKYRGRSYAKMRRRRQKKTQSERKNLSDQTKMPMREYFRGQNERVLRGRHRVEEVQMSDLVAKVFDLKA